MCQIENLTVDAVVHGSIMEVPTFDGGAEYIAAEFRQPHVDGIFCSEHGYLFENDENVDINEAVRKHLEDNDGNDNR